MRTFKEYLGESTSDDVNKIHKSLRKVESVKDKKYIFKLIKSVADVGFYDELSSSDFKKNYQKVIDYIGTNPNLQRIIDQNSVETDFNVLSNWNKD